VTGNLESEKEELSEEIIQLDTEIKDLQDSKVGIEEALAKNDASTIHDTLLQQLEPC
jgi:cell division protein FtsB